MPELSHLYDKEQAESYGHMTAYEILMTELSAVNLAHNSSTDDNSHSPIHSPKESNSPVHSPIDILKIEANWSENIEIQKEIL